jgi:hypothetical protein
MLGATSWLSVAVVAMAPACVAVLCQLAIVPLASAADDASDTTAPKARQSEVFFICMKRIPIGRIEWMKNRCRQATGSWSAAPHCPCAVPA